MKKPKKKRSFESKKIKLNYYFSLYTAVVNLSGQYCLAKVTGTYKKEKAQKFHNTHRKKIRERGERERVKKLTKAQSARVIEDGENCKSCSFSFSLSWSSPIGR